MPEQNTMQGQNPSIYSFLKDNGLTSKSEQEFNTEYADSAKAKELYGFFTENQLTSKDFDTFYQDNFGGMQQPEQPKLTPDFIKNSTQSVIDSNNPESRLYNGKIDKTSVNFTPEDINYAKSMLPEIDNLIKRVKIPQSKPLDTYQKNYGMYGGGVDLGNKEQNVASTTKATLEKAKDYYEAVANGDSNAASRFWNGLKTVDLVNTLTLGIKGMSNSIDIYEAAKNYSEGKATPEEQNLLVAKAMLDEVQQLAQNDRATSIGLGLSDMAPWLAQFAITGGVGSTATKLSTKALESMMAKNLAGKITGKLMTGIVGTAAQTASQVPLMLQGTAERMTDQYQLQDGNLQKTEEGKGFGEALGRTFANNFLEVYSERVFGDAVDKLGTKALSKVLDSKALANTKVSDIINSIRNNRYVKLTNKTLGLNTPLTENIEEAFTGLTQPLVTEDSLDEAQKQIQEYFTKENLVRVFLTTAAMGAGAGVLQAPGEIYHNAKSDKGKKIVDGFDQEQSDLWNQSLSAETIEERKDAWLNLWNSAAEKGATKSELNSMMHYYQTALSELENNRPAQQPVQSGSQQPSEPVSPDSGPQFTVDPRSQAEMNFRAMGENYAHKETGLLTAVDYVTPGTDENVKMFVKMDAGDGSYLLEDDNGNQVFTDREGIAGDFQEMTVDDFVSMKMAELDQQEQLRQLVENNQMEYEGQLLTRNLDPNINSALKDGEFWFDQNGDPVEVPNSVIQAWEKSKQRQSAGTPNVVSRVYGKTQVNGTKDEQGNILASEPYSAEQAAALKEEVEKATGGNATVIAQAIPNEDSTLPVQYQVTIQPKQVDLDAELLGQPAQTQPENQVSPEMQAQVQQETAPKYMLNGQPIDQATAKARVKAAILKGNIDKLAGLEISNDKELLTMIEKAFPKPKAKFTLGKKTISNEDAMDWIIASDNFDELNELKFENIDSEPAISEAYQKKQADFEQVRINEQLRLQEQAKAEKSKSDEIHNKLVRDLNNFNSMTDADRRKTSTHFISQQAANLGYLIKMDGTKLRITDNGKEIGYRGKISPLLNSESHRTLNEYPEEVQQTARYFLTPMLLTGVDLNGLTPAKANQAILDIQSGKKTVDANYLLDQIENIHNTGVVKLKSDHKTGFTGAEIPISEYMSLINEELTPEEEAIAAMIPEDVAMNIFNEQLTPEILDQFENLIFSGNENEQPTNRGTEESISDTQKSQKSETITEKVQEKLIESNNQEAENLTNTVFENQESFQKNQLQNEESEKSSQNVNTNINLDNIDTDNFIYVTHQTDQRGLENILKNGFDIRRGLNGTTLFGNKESIQQQIQDINSGKGHRGSDRMFVFAFPKTEFQNVRQLDQISDQLIDNGQLTIPSQYLFDVHEKPVEQAQPESNQPGENTEQGKVTAQKEQGQGVNEVLEENVNDLKASNSESKEELELRLQEERKQKILSDGTSFDSEFDLIQPKDIKSVDDVISNVNKIITTLKENEGNGKFRDFEGFASNGNFSKNAGDQIREYFIALDVLPNELRNDMRKEFSDNLKINNVQELIDWAVKQYKQIAIAVPPVVGESFTPGDSAGQVEQATSEVNTNPTEAQKEAGNYKKGHVSIQGMDITIENPKGSFRRGVDEDGRAWETEMKSHYGYFKRTNGKDGDQIDTFIGENPDSQAVFVVDQNNPKTGEFDESKVMLGYNTADEAKAAYLSNYEPDWKGFGSITPVSVDEFKTWLYDGAKQRKPFAEYKDTPAPVEENNAPDRTLEAKQVQDVAGQDSGQRPAVPQSPLSKVLEEGKKEVEGKKAKGITTVIEEDADTLVYGTKTNLTRLSVKGLSADEIKEELDFESNRKARAEKEIPEQEEYLRSKMITDVSIAVDEALKANRKTIEITKVTIPWLEKKLAEKQSTQLPAEQQNNPSFKEEAPKNDQQKQQDSAYGQNNKIVSKERADELRKRLRDKLNNLNSGFDPEVLAIGTELAAYHIEAGARKFADFSKAMIEDIGDAIKPYLKAIYNGARDLPGMEELEPEMTEYAEVKKANIDEILKQSTSGNKKGFITTIQSKLGVEKLNIVSIRKIAAENGFTEIKDTTLQEYVELAVIGKAKEIVSQNISQDEKYRQIVDLCNSQPTISMRSSERIEKQQYSTPIPMSFLAGEFVNAINPQSGLEPSAGNGMMVFNVDQSKFIANEIDVVRLENLREQGFAQVTNQDGTTEFNIEPVDAVITNPPFGKSEARDYNGYKISGLDEQMVVNALQNLTDNGRASIIIGGHTKYKSNGTLAGEKAFFNYLYNFYNVSDVINMDGGLYSKQGTSFETRLILINGRRKENSRVYAPLEKNTNTDIVTTFDELQQRVNKAINENTILQPEIPERNSNGTGSRSGNGRSSSKERTGTLDFGGTDSGSNQPGNGQAGNAGNSNKQKGTSESNDGNGRASDIVDRDKGNDDPSNRGSERGIQPKDTSELLNRPDELAGDKVEVDLSKEKTPYPARSKSEQIGSVVPTNVAQTLSDVLSVFKDIDEYVQIKLGYNSKDELFNALAAEQIDSVAMAIYQIENGGALIIGDMTGVGKGRQAAAILRYAHLQGKKPIFVTEKAHLFSDIYRDLRDIGSADLNPFIFNSKSQNSDPTIVDENGTVIYSPLSEAVKRPIFQSGKMPEQYDYAVLTYSQLNAAAGKPSAKKDFFSSIVEDNILVLDESHNAGGEGNTGTFMANAIPSTKGVVFLSGTFAKRADNMPIYALKTAMSQANMSNMELIEAIKTGGVPLQEIMSKNLTQSGQMIRRERDFTGVTIDWKTIEDADTHFKAYDSIIKVFNDLIQFQREYIDPIIEEKNDELAAMQANAEHTAGTADFGINNVPFASKTFNLTRQLLFSLKAKNIAEEAIEELKAGRRPVIAVANTMEGFMNELGEIGEKISNHDFSTTLMKGLHGLFRFTEVDGMGEHENLFLTVDDLTQEGKDRYYEIEDFIKKMSVGISISPIDVIKDAITKAGYSIGEMTGRSNEMVFNPDGTGTIQKRTNTDKKKLTREFNAGKIDALIMNQSASTGISLHASEKVADQRQRIMLSAQTQLDVNTEVQMRGRIDRTGQVARGAYRYILSPIPAEQRMTMMFKVKLKSLDANTTSSQKSKTNEIAIVDFLNKYGDKICVDHLKEDLELNEKLLDPMKFEGMSEADIESFKAPEGAALKIAGRVALLPIAEQQKFYDEVTEKYNTLINYLNDTNANDLEITTLPLRAETTEKIVIAKGRGGTSPFAQDSYRETVLMDVLKKPLKAEEIRHEIKKLTGGMEAIEYRDSLREKLDKYTEDLIDSETQKSNDGWEAAERRHIEKANKIADKNNYTHEREPFLQDYIYQAKQIYDNALNSRIDKLRRKSDGIRRVFNMFPVGKVIRIPITSDINVNTAYTDGVLMGYKLGNKMNPSTITAVFATLDSRKKIEVPLSKIDFLNGAYAETMQFRHTITTTLDNWDEKIPTKSRKTGYIVTGNILQAFAGNEGHLIAYTDIDGNIKEGILLPDNYKPNEQQMRVQIIQKIDDIKNGVVIRDISGNVTIKRQNSGGYSLEVPLSKQSGGMYFLDAGLRDLVIGRDFRQMGGRMVGAISEGNLEKVLQYMSGKFNTSVNVDIARTAPQKEELTPVEPAQPKSPLQEVLDNGKQVVEIKKIQNQELPKNPLEGKTITAPGMKLLPVEEFRHTKTGQILYNVRINGRSDLYDHMVTVAKRHNPHDKRHPFNTRFSKGFLFEKKEYAQRFKNAIDGNDPQFRIIGETGAANLDKAEEATTRLDNLAIAREMEQAGKDVKSIRLATGWEKGVDGKWRYEVPDGKLKQDKFPFEELQSFDTKGRLIFTDHAPRKYKLSEIIDDPELFKAYPELEDLHVEFNNSNIKANAAYINSSKGLLPKGIYLNNLNLVNENKDWNNDFTKKYLAATDDTKSTLVHEIQHAIQEIEGFARGGNTNTLNQNNLLAEQDRKSYENNIELLSDFAEKEAEKANKLDDLNKVETPEQLFEHIINSEYYSESTKKFAQNIKEQGRKLRSSNRNISDIDYYKSLAGEVESRNVQTRMNMTPEERLNTLLSETEDVSREDQIVLMDGLGVSNLSLFRPSLSEIKSKINELQAKAPSAAPVVLVGAKEEIPEAIKSLNGFNRKSIEAVYYGGKIYIFEESVRSIDHLVSTWIHENGIHNGIKNIVPSGEWKRFMGLVYDSFAESAKNNPDFKKIFDYVNKDYSFSDKEHKAEEMLAYLAEKVVSKSDLSFMEQSAWKKYMDMFRDFLRKLFNFNSGLLTEKQITEITRFAVQSNFQQKEQSQRNVPLLEYMARAKEQVKEKKLQSLPETITVNGVERPTRNDGSFSPETNDIRYRMKAPVLDYLENASTAYREKRATKRNLKQVAEKVREFVQDHDLPIRRLEEEVKRLGGKIADNMKPYRDMSNSYGRNETLFKNFISDKFEPILKTINKIKKSGMSGEYILPYVICKHALERNPYMREREFNEWLAVNEEATPEEIEEKQAELAKKDYSGVRPFDPENEYDNPEELAQNIVDEFEDNVSVGLVAELWDNIKNATSTIVDTWNAGQTLSKEQADEMKARFNHFVPLRGWREGAAKELVYKRGEGFSTSMKTAKGRSSLADNPLAYIEQVAFKAIGEQVDNEVKTKLLNLVIGNYGPEFHKLYQLKKAYYVKDGIDENGKDVWRVTTDRPSEEMFKSGDAKVKIYNQYERLRTPAQSQEHEVLVKRPGGDYIVVMVGENLPVAQAMNHKNTMYRSVFGNEIHDAEDLNRIATFDLGFGIIPKFTMGGLNNFLKGMYTSYNIVFPLTNFMRDVPEATMTALIKGDKGYKVVPNYRKAMPAIVRSLIGKSKPNGKYDQMLKEFRLYGGNTGYTHSKTPEEIEKEVNSELRNLARKGTLKGLGIGTIKGIKKSVVMWNQLFEDATRFSIYITSREMGKTPGDSASDAKEASVNFNRKGKSSKAFDAVWAFWNVAIQSLQKNASLAKRYPKAFTGVALSWIALGFFEALMNDTAPDDDEDYYYRNSDYVRENYLVLPNFYAWITEGNVGDKYLRIPLPQFWRGFKSIGAIGYDVLVKENMDATTGAGKAIANFMASLMPIDFGGFYQEGEFSFAPIIPTVAKPIAEISANRNYMGYTIAKEPFTKEQENILAESGLGKENVNPAIKFFTDALFKMGGGDNETRFYEENGEIKEVNPIADWNPSYIEHLIKGYTGGSGAVISDAFTTAMQAIDKNQPVDFKNIPFVNSFIRKTPDAKWKVIEEYYNLKDGTRGFEPLKRTYRGEDDKSKFINVATNPYYNEVSSVLDAYDKKLTKVMKYMDYKTAEGSEEVLSTMKEAIEKVKEIKLKYNRK